MVGVYGRLWGVVGSSSVGEKGRRTNSSGPCGQDFERLRTDQQRPPRPIAVGLPSLFAPPSHRIAVSPSTASAFAFAFIFTPQSTPFILPSRLPPCLSGSGVLGWAPPPSSYVPALHLCLPPLTTNHCRAVLLSLRCASPKAAPASSAAASTRAVLSPR